MSQKFFLSIKIIECMDKHYINGDKNRICVNKQAFNVFNAKIAKKFLQVIKQCRVQVIKLECCQTDFLKEY